MSYGGGIRHAKRSGRGDTADATQVNATQWNEQHDHPSILLVALHPFREVWNGSASGALEEIGRGAMRTHVDLSQVSHGFMSFYMDAFDLDDVASYVTAQYSLDEGVTWASLDGADGPKVSIAGLGDEVRISARFPIAPAARTDVLIRFMQFGPAWYSLSGLSLWQADNAG
jgi:hypothetical protein